MQSKIPVSVVLYANTIPLVWGLTHSSVNELIDLSLDIPSEGAKKLINGKAEVGLVPVVTLLQMPQLRPIFNYCIGATSDVRTVVLVSPGAFTQIRRVYLDFHSRTSVTLIQLLNAEYWHMPFEFVPTDSSFDYLNLHPEEAAVLIGDKVFETEGHYSYSLDLAKEWIKCTGLPFVFACWVANRDLDDSVINAFNEAMQYGIKHTSEAIDAYLSDHPEKIGCDLQHYLKHNISYPFDSEKQKGLDLFLQMVSKNNLI